MAFSVFHWAGFHRRETGLIHPHNTSNNNDDDDDDDDVDNDGDGDELD